MKSLLIVVSVVCVLTSCGAMIMEPLGQSFFLPSGDLLAPQLGGMNLFKGLHAACFKSVDVRSTTNLRSTFSNIDSFYSKLSTDTSVSGSLQGAYTMGATVNVKTGSISAGKTDVRGTSIDVYTVVNTTYLDSDCYKSDQSHLIDEMVRQLDHLPLEIGKPESRGAWQHYETFMQRFGSHMIYQANYGSLLKWWTFAKQKESYTERQIAAKSCLDFTGVTQAGKVNVTACNDISSEELQNATSMTTSQNLEMRGGSTATRNALMSERTNELIARLMEEGKRDPYPIQYKYEPIWEIIAMKFYDNATRFAKAMNMRQFYEGFLDFGCTFIESPTTKEPLRIFRKSLFHEPLLPAYECFLERDGCHDDKDCHLFGFTSFCYGPRCVEHVPPSEGNKATSARIRTYRTGSHSDGINRSCYMPFIKCDTHWSYNHRIWDGSAFYNALAMDFHDDKVRAAGYNVHEYAAETRDPTPMQFHALYGAKRGGHGGTRVEERGTKIKNKGFTKEEL